MTEPDLVVIRFGEVFLKGENRPAFLRQLRDNLARAVRGSGWRLQAVHGRFLLRPTDDPARLPVGRLLTRVCRVPGVVSASPARETTPELGALEAAASALAADTVPPGARTFAVRTRRSDKSLPFISTDVGRQAGAAVARATGLSVDLSNPDFEVGVEAGDLTFVFTETRPGPGGLPVGASGRVLLLLSGGIDSPVAGWMALKRGCRLDAVYFHSYPLIGDGARDKVLDLARILASFGGPLRVHVVPFADAQRAVRDAARPRLFVLLYRRLMLRIAEQLARQTGAGALVTGESLGQVASQTLENLDCIGAVADLPVLRPLIGMDKAETVSRARQLGTYDVSILPHPDCCSLFVPKHPETRGRREVLARAEERLDVKGLVAAAVEGTEVERVESR